MTRSAKSVSTRLLELERMLERSMERLRHPETGRALLEAIPEVLDDVEDHLEPSGGRGRVFPYARLVVGLRVAAADRSASRTLVEDLPERIRERLRARGCEPGADLAVDVRFLPPASGDDERPWHIRYQRTSRTAAPPPPPPAPAPPPTLDLTVLRGRTGEKEHALALARINLGRLERVASASGRGARKNHVWFAASEDTVSRAHARIERFGRDYLLFDEGSASGTRLLRSGEEIELMPRASRGVPLRDGDRIELGRGCVVEVRVRAADESAAATTRRSPGGDPSLEWGPRSTSRGRSR
jgi:hypothetical protein